MTLANIQFSRRNLLKSGAVVGLTAMSPFLTFRSGAAAEGELQMVAATPNPNGAFERLFLLKGDPFSGPISTIITAEGNPVPQSSMAVRRTPGSAADAFQ
ncbi:hypothetical protein OEG86_05305 [Hoeflea alexandrii]|uniref:hypothetical protein n=1 Tax=Hoeflea alexandrii TaxID=288436 RepID=UPI002271B302|nr:hypothetical protein [Hoeflea alexandrii]MCY0151754.1 hypothetical protein [Hoeflea alexandrii]